MTETNITLIGVFSSRICQQFCSYKLYYVARGYYCRRSSVCRSSVLENHAVKICRFNSQSF